MKLIFVPVLLLTVTLSFAQGQASKKHASRQTRDERELLRLQKLISEASERKDAATLNRYIADDFVLTISSCQPDSFGRYFDKAQVVARWTAASGAATASSTVSDQRVEVFGDTAVIFARITDTVKDENGERTMRTWVSDVWVRRNGRWRWLASHENLLGAPQ